jgi:hypothetical protein
MMSLSLLLGRRFAELPGSALKTRGRVNCSLSMDYSSILSFNHTILIFTQVADVETYPSFSKSLIRKHQRRPVHLSSTLSIALSILSHHGSRKVATYSSLFPFANKW